MKKINLMKRITDSFNTTLRLIVIFLSIPFIMNVRSMASDISGTVFGSGSPISGATVTLFAAGTGAPVQLAQSTTGNDGTFTLNGFNTTDVAVLYLIAKGGKITGAVDQGPGNSLTLMSLLGSKPPSNVKVN